MINIKNLKVLIFTTKNYDQNPIQVFMKTYFYFMNK